MIYPLIWLVVSSLRPERAHLPRPEHHPAGSHLRQLRHGVGRPAAPLHSVPREHRDPGPRRHHRQPRVVLDGGLRVRAIAVPRASAVLLDHARDDHAADPRHHRAAVRDLLAVGLGQYVPAAPRSEVPGDGGVLRVPHGAVHPLAAQGARRGCAYRWRWSRAHLRAGAAAAHGARARDDGDLHFHLDMERLLRPAHLSDVAGELHRLPRAAPVPRLLVELQLRRHVRDVGRLAAARCSSRSSSASATWSRASPRPASSKTDQEHHA